MDDQLRLLKRAVALNPGDVYTLHRYIAALEKAIGSEDADSAIPYLCEQCLTPVDLRPYVEQLKQYQEKIKQDHEQFERAIETIDYAQRQQQRRQQIAEQSPELTVEEIEEIVGNTNEKKEDIVFALHLSTLVARMHQIITLFEAGKTAEAGHELYIHFEDYFVDGHEELQEIFAVMGYARP